MILAIMFLCVMFFLHNKYEIAIWDKMGVLGYPRAQQAADDFIALVSIITGYSLYICLLK